MFFWFFRSPCYCYSEISTLSRSIERLEEALKSEKRMNNMMRLPSTISQSSRAPLEKKKFEFDYQYYQDNAPDYLCAGSTNGQIPTQFSKTDFDKVVSKHLIDQPPFQGTRLLLLAPLALTKDVTDADERFMFLSHYPTHLNVYESEWGLLYGTKVILYDDKILKNNPRSKSINDKLEGDFKVYSSFLVSINDKDEIQKVTHIKSTRS